MSLSGQVQPSAPTLIEISRYKRTNALVRNRAHSTPGKWPFLRTTYVGLQQLEDSLTDSIDLTEGNQQLTITGCLNAYRRAILHRTLDLSQAVVASWNAGHPIGSVVLRPSSA